MELKLPEQIDVIDITMRDGLQNEEHYVPLEAKLYLADRLIKAGFKRLEVGSISHVAYVPQFKDVDELLLKLPKDVDVEYTVLALTPKAIERVGGLLDRGGQDRPGAHRPDCHQRSIRHEEHAPYPPAAL